MNKFISVKKATQNNLKNISVDIPRNRITVITGVSGSGKSTLAFDTLYAEGQRRFVESLSSYARQFLERMGKPEVESITGLPPAIAIDQKTPHKNPRSTVGTTTEIYDYLRVLFARIGETICESCGKPVKKDTPSHIVNEILNWPEEDKVYILFSLKPDLKDYKQELERLRKLGFSRVIIGQDNNTIIEDEVDFSNKNITYEDIFILVDRIKIDRTSNNITRITDSVELALKAGYGRITVRNISKNIERKFSDIYECADCQITYQIPEPNLFSFNNPRGACSFCDGFGTAIDYSEDLLIPDESLTLAEGAVHPFRMPSAAAINKAFVEICIANQIPTDIPYSELDAKHKSVIWKGKGNFIGILGYLRHLENKNYKIQNRVIISKYKTLTTCTHCNGTRLRRSARQVFLQDYNLPEMVEMSILDLYNYLQKLELSEYQRQATEPIMAELIARTKMLCDIGLDYLTLSRSTHTLSGGEYQRINLASALASSLVGTLYILDEPSIGMHPRDTNRLLDILKRLRNLGNTIVVVEHDPDIISKADFIIDMGPNAGANGGDIVYSGDFSGLLTCADSITSNYYLNNKISTNTNTNNINNISNINNNKQDANIKQDISIDTYVPSFEKKQTPTDKNIIIYGAAENNLQIDKLVVPLNCLTVITGVSGSGKSTLVHNVIYPGIRKAHGTITTDLKIGKFKNILGSDNINGVELVDQSPIGRSSRSIPATYLHIFDHIREIYANTIAARQQGLKPGFFSFNIAGGRCETCEGAGITTVDMQFLPDIQIVCETCNGTRYKKEARNILFRGKSIVEVLDMTVLEAIEFFSEITKITSKLQLLVDVGLGYIKLGQSSSVLSGGEAQRVKLAAHIDTNNSNWLYIFDEPTTGLHMADVEKLQLSLGKLIERGNSVLVIEHNLSIISAADWIIDLGPEAGLKGGKVVGEGTPLQISQLNTHTGIALNKYFS